MQDAWQSAFLDALLELDVAESPHGLYGARLAHAADPTRLPTLAQVLLSPKRTDFIGKLGWQDRGSNARQNEIVFQSVGSHTVSMHVFGWASTKVRHFGSTYRLDMHNRKPDASPRWNLEKMAPKLVFRW